METFVVIGAAIIWVLDKAGVFGWVSKAMHARLPREKSMAMRKMLVPGIYRIRTMQGELFTVRLDQIEVLDNCLVIDRQIVLAHMAWESITYVGES